MKSAADASRYVPRTYWRRLLAGTADLRAVGWPDLSESFNQWMYRGQVAQVHRLFGDVQGLRVLDVGSGVGFWIQQWEASGARSVTGVDLTHESVRHLRSRFPQNMFVQANVADGLPLQGPFDLISVMSVLLHITCDADYLAALRHLREVSQLGTRLILMEPATYAEPVTFVQGTHSRARRIEDINTMLLDSGWDLRRVQPALWLLNNPVETSPAWLCRVLQWQWALTSAVARYEWSGFLYGAVAYPLDLLLCRLSWGPSTKLILANAR